ncbi:MAG: hypothetical protein KIG88_08320 [Weeksellaceae bacterium]|nr:hypothetical protein [Weeksellaceae bacterium]
MKQFLLLFFLVFMHVTSWAQQIDRFPIYPGCERYMKDNQKLNGCFQERLAADLKLYTKNPSNKKSEEKTEMVKISFVVDQKGYMKNFELVESESEESSKKLMKRLNELAKYNEEKKRKIEPASYRKRPVQFKITYVGLQNI